MLELKIRDSELERVLSCFGLHWENWSTYLHNWTELARMRFADISITPAHVSKVGVKTLVHYWLYVEEGLTWYPGRRCEYAGEIRTAVRLSLSPGLGLEAARTLPSQNMPWCNSKQRFEMDVHAERWQMSIRKAETSKRYKGLIHGWRRRITRSGIW